MKEFPKRHHNILTFRGSFPDFGGRQQIIGKFLGIRGLAL